MKKGKGEPPVMDDPALRELADILIERHALPAAEFVVRYLWKRAGGKCYGQCIKVSGLNRFISGYDFYVWLAADHAKGLSPDQREALLYHELRHIGSDEDGNPVLVDHEFEGFRDELDIYGAWHPSYAAAKPHFEQAALLAEV
jgi:hypothetical protein